jgi:hypothetical protein
MPGHSMAVSFHIFPIYNTPSIPPFERIVACRPVARQRPGNKQLLNDTIGTSSKYWIKYIIRQLKIVASMVRDVEFCTKYVPYPGCLNFGVSSTSTLSVSLFHFQWPILSRSQSPRGLRHEPSSPAQTLGSWARIPLEAWISVCVYSVFMLSCVQVETASVV